MARTSMASKAMASKATANKALAMATTRPDLLVGIPWVLQ